MSADNLGQQLMIISRTFLSPTMQILLIGKSINLIRFKSQKNKLFIFLIEHIFHTIVHFI